MLGAACRCGSSTFVPGAVPRISLFFKTSARLYCLSFFPFWFAVGLWTEATVSCFVMSKTVRGKAKKSIRWTRLGRREREESSSLQRTKWVGPSEKEPFLPPLPGGGKSGQKVGRKLVRSVRPSLYSGHDRASSFSVKGQRLGST